MPRTIETITVTPWQHVGNKNPFVIPAKTPVTWTEDVFGYVLSEQDAARLSGNKHDSKHRYVFVESANVVLTEQEYMADSSKLHFAYEIQFATDRTREIVKFMIGEDAIKASTDPHFNDIPLYKWDALNESIKSSVDRKKKRAAQIDTYQGGIAPNVIMWSLSDAVCIAKAVAAEIRGF